MAQYDVISPDGFSIHPTDVYENKEKAIEAFNNWKKRFEHQGYYSSNNRRIPLNELEEHCTFKIIE
jgi:hypothetical protein